MTNNTDAGKAAPKYRAEQSADDAHAGWRVVSDDGVLCMYCSESEAEMIARACNAHDALLAQREQLVRERSELIAALEDFIDETDCIVDPSKNGLGEIIEQAREKFRAAILSARGDL